MSEDAGPTGRSALGDRFVRAVLVHGSATESWIGRQRTEPKTTSGLQPRGCTSEPNGLPCPNC